MLIKKFPQEIRISTALGKLFSIVKANVSITLMLVLILLFEVSGIQEVISIDLEFQFPLLLLRISLKISYKLLSKNKEDIEMNVSSQFGNFVIINAF